MSSLYKYINENIDNLDINIVLKKTLKILKQTAKEFPEYAREDLIQVAQIRIWQKLDKIIQEWKTLSSYNKKIDHYIRTLARNEMKRYMIKETFCVSLDIEIPNKYTIVQPQYIVPEFISNDTPFYEAIGYVKRQILNGLSISKNILNQLLPNKNITQILLDYIILDIKKQILMETKICYKEDIFYE